MEIYLDRRAVKQIRHSAADAIEEGDYDTLREDIVAAFTDEQIEEIERRIDSNDMHDFVSEVLDEWSGEDNEELFELLEAHLGEAGVDLKYAAVDLDDDDDDDVADVSPISEEDGDDLSIVSEDDEL